MYVDVEATHVCAGNILIDPLCFQKTCIGAYDNLSGSAGIDSLQQTAENVAVGGESQLSEALTDAVKLTQDLDIIELGDQASLQIPSVSSYVGSVGRLLLCRLFLLLISVASTHIGIDRSYRRRRRASDSSSCYVFFVFGVTSKSGRFTRFQGTCQGSLR